MRHRQCITDVGQGTTALVEAMLSIRLSLERILDGRGVKSAVGQNSNIFVSLASVVVAKGWLQVLDILGYGRVPCVL